MLLSRTSQKFRTLFLATFLKEVIANSMTEEMKLLKQMDKEKFREKVKERFDEKKAMQEYYIVPRKQSITEIIDFGKIAVMLDDPRIKLIECEGPGKKIIITGSKERIITNFSLSEREILNIINSFSKATQTPLESVATTLVYENVIMHSIFSPVVKPKFIISKS